MEYDRIKQKPMLLALSMKYCKKKHNSTCGLWMRDDGGELSIFSVVRIWNAFPLPHIFRSICSHRILCFLPFFIDVGPILLLLIQIALQIQR